MNREPVSWKILLLPVWILSVVIGSVAVGLMCVGTTERKLCFMLVYMFMQFAPAFALGCACEREYRKRREIEMRWRKDSEHTFK